ncbi:MAG: FapA family protein, partial [Chitinivibrionales bacterium]|nr:FapA family protein [Chitinivibrionales bacterium]
MIDQSLKKEPEFDSKKLVDRLEANLLEIETREILEGMTHYELTERGFVGDKDITIDRARFKETSEKEKLVFEDGVEYQRLDDRDAYESIDIDKIMLVRDVQPGQVIATRELNETVVFNAGNNVDKGDVDKREIYRAKVKGKVVIIRDAMHVFPSDIDSVLKAHISDDGMRAIMDCSPGYGAGRELNYESVLDELRKIRVVFGTREKAIREAIEESNEKRIPLHNVIVAEGRPPSTGGNAAIDYKFNTDDDKQTFKIMPDGRIDYKGSASIPSAQKDQLLATVTLPAEGTAGMNVLGKEIPAEKGTDTFLVAGKGVRTSPDGRSFFAAASGCVVHNPPVIEVLDLYEVRGDVDYSTGSIDFNGSVVISGTVREGFEVNAVGDIIVQKMVEAARLMAGRDVRILGGVHGQGKGLIAAGRDVYVEFAQNVRIEAQGS